jgi:tetratricopeptide (TPR) repeat protein
MSNTDAALDQAIGEYLGLIGDPVATLGAALAQDPSFILGHTTIAALNTLGGVPGDAPVVREALAAADALAPDASPRERLHISAANAWAEGDIEGAAVFWETALKTDPADLLALRLAHDTHFFLGAAAKLRDVPVSVLPAYATGTRARGFVLGMAAFGLEETGDYEAAEKAGRAAADINPADSWGVHAVAHVLEMQDRGADGIAWLRGLEPHWAPATGLAVHQYWHLALFLIEQGRLDEVLELYDSRIQAHEGSMILDLVDAAALLWRLELLGVDVGARWQSLVPLWSAHAEAHVLAFNDIHIAFTLAAAGEQAGADALEASILAYAARADGTNAKISQSLGLPLIQALRAFRAGDFARTVVLLGPIYTDLAPVGGSNAQRDLFIQTLGIAAFKTGDLELVRKVAAERRRLKIGCPRAWAGLN